MINKIVYIDMTTGGLIRINFIGADKDKSFITMSKSQLKQQLFKDLEGDSEFLITAKNKGK